MNKLRIDHEWMTAEGVRGPELRATWARLEIRVGDVCLTQVEDASTGVVRKGIYVPLYPLAEWIVTNWWCLLYEIGTPARKRSHSFLRRHSLASASEGFPLPALRLEAEGSRIHFVWSSVEYAENRLYFLSSGEDYVETDGLRQTLTDFVQAVLMQLEAAGVTDTLLAEDWNAIISADNEEFEYCRLAAMLGCDPYSLAADREATIVEVANELPRELMDEFFASANVQAIGDEAAAIRDFISSVRASARDLPSLREARTEMPKFDVSAQPWQIGYDCARRLRTMFNLNGARFKSADDIGKAFRLDNRDWHEAIHDGSPVFGFCDAVAAVTRSGSPEFVVRQKHPRSRVFGLCRALFEYLAHAEHSAALVTPVSSDRQKSNRAFAAEFLAPANLLRERLPSKIVSEDDVNEIADDFNVSDFVIRYQLVNHGLAEVVAS